MLDVKLAYNTEKSLEIEKEISADSLNTNMLVLADFQVRSKETGARLASVALKIFNYSDDKDDALNHHLHLTLVDVKTHRIIWSNFTSISYGIFACGFNNAIKDSKKLDRNRIKTLVKDLLSTLPEATLIVLDKNNLKPKN